MTIEVTMSCHIVKGRRRHNSTWFWHSSTWEKMECNVHLHAIPLHWIGDSLPVVHSTCPQAVELCVQLVQSDELLLLDWCRRSSCFALMVCTDSRAIVRSTCAQTFVLLCAQLVHGQSSCCALNLCTDSRAAVFCTPIIKSLNFVVQNWFDRFVCLWLVDLQTWSLPGFATFRHSDDFVPILCDTSQSGEILRFCFSHGKVARHVNSAAQSASLGLIHNA